ncbi:sensor histidine kinase [Paenibacillus paeoniae]|uniref:histidine kinase n=1 Tax=Paenibacillus paeoniae TaxID=2292705 RepID=A0A371PNM5_9BACL|nr:HAMP domain-containing sensor histidine kinase [Paenibacillus paeoniae]REK77743.1 sensor histidine kinase [Paenibacillus paeoniae]
MNLTKAWLRWVTFIALIAAGLLLPYIPTGEASPAQPAAPAKIVWDAYYYGNLPEEQIPVRWHSLATEDYRDEGAGFGQDLWLKGELPPGASSSGELLIYYYMVDDFELALFVGDKPVLVSEPLLPAGFVTWRIVSYASDDNDSTLLVRLSPHQDVEKGFEVWSGPAASLTLKQLQREVPAWVGAAILMILSLISLIGFGLQRSQPLFIYFSVFFISLAIDLAILWGGWQYVVPEQSLMAWGTAIHFNWYVGHAVGILITYDIVATSKEAWVRKLGYGVGLYAAVAAAASFMLGERAQLILYKLFYGYISTAILIIILFVLFRALRRRRDTEIRLFAVGNVAFVIGLVMDRVIGGQPGGVPRVETIMNAMEKLVHMSWTFAGSAVAIGCLSIIMAMRLLRMLQLHSTNRVLQEANRELSKANDKLERLDDIRGNMYSEVSHELNTPITSIKGYVQLMMNGTIQAGDPRYLQVILDKTLTMERTVEDMMEMARLENKHMLFEPEMLPINELISQVLSKFEMVMLESGIELKWSLLPVDATTERIPAIYADPLRVEQVLVNVLSNARKFSKAGSVVQVKLSLENTDSKRSPSLLVRVSDQGSGIAEEDQPHVFERYYRGKTAKANAISGIGLGLSICREIMAAQQGEIWLEHSSAAGSTFQLRFPLCWANDEIKDN